MKVGFIGLGKMGYNMVLRLIKEEHEVVVYNKTKEKTIQISKEGATPSYSLKELVDKLNPPRVIWVMVPHEAVSEVFFELSSLIEKGDLLIDGGNSNFRETVKRSEELRKKGVGLLDVGVSGGLAAAKTGYCIMVGGDQKNFEVVEPIIKSMSVKNGYGYFGESGAGHYVKMVHNAIEYGMMQAMGEGYDLIKKGPFKDVDLLNLSRVWNNGSIIRSFLMEMAIKAFDHSPGMEGVKGFIPDSGEGRWAVEESIKYKVPFNVNTFALMARFRSREGNTFSDKVVASLRNEFGGHGVKKE